MELKYEFVGFIVAVKTRSNCTFMELKSSFVSSVMVRGLVLIVPLWN